MKDILDELGEILEAKNKAYGNTAKTAGAILMYLYPQGVKPHQYRDMLLIVRIIDKLGRIATGDTTEDPFLDIAGYGVLGAKMRRDDDATIR